jgi:hypothetical protein
MILLRRLARPSAWVDLQGVTVVSVFPANNFCLLGREIKIEPVHFFLNFFLLPCFFPCV